MRELRTNARAASRRRAVLAAGSLAAAGLLPRPAAGQSYPDRPVRLVVPFPAGGGADILARTWTQRLAQELGQNVVVDNRPGAGGNVGAEAVARAQPDGYTLLYGTNGTHGINKALYGKVGFDPQKDFTPIARLTRIPAVLVVNKDLPAQSVQELLALVRAAPGKYNYGSAGNGTTSHLAAEIFKARTRTFIVHVPYRGGAAAMTDLVAGQVQLMIEVMPNTVAQIRAGRIRALAVSTAQRVPAVQELPTIAESGVPGFDVSAWDAVFAPAGTPAPIVQRLGAALARTLQDPEIVKALAARGADVVVGSPDELAQHVARELEVWGAAVKRSGAKVD